MLLCTHIRIEGIKRDRIDAPKWISNDEERDVYFVGVFEYVVA